MRNITKLFFLYLHESQFQWSFPTENFHHDFELFLLIVHLFDDATKTIEGTERNFNSLTYYVGNRYFIGLLDGIYCTKHTINLGLSQRIGICCPAQKSDNICCIAQTMGYLTYKSRLDQDITGIEISLFGYFLAVAN